LIQPEDLHLHILEGSKSRKEIPDSKEWIIQTLGRMGEAPIGRTRLSRLANEEGAEIGEGKLRRLIRELRDEGLVDIEDKIGIKLTEKGKQMI
jgi:Mn-dependent DtxR family transcriptional regulator